ncbi:MAG: PAS domain S-box protein [Gaiellaceae bacterium]
MRPGIAWSYLTIASVLAVATSVASADGRMFAALTAAATVAMLAGIAVNRPAGRLVWLLIAAALGAWSVAAWITPTSVTAPHASFTGFLASQAPAYVLLLAAVIALMYASGPVPLGRSDAWIALVAACVVVWPVALEPNLTPWRAAHAGSVAMVAGDLVTLTILLRVAFTPTIRLRAYHFLLAAGAMMTMGDVVNVSPALTGSVWSHVVHAGYGLECAFVAAAALHPSMRRVPLPAPAEIDPSSRRTLAVLSGVLFAPFLGLGLSRWLNNADPYAYAAIGVFLVTVALVKILRLMHQMEVLRLSAEMSEQRFRMMFDASGIGISLGAHGMLTETNEAYQRMLGYTADELSCMHYNEITYPDDIGLDEELAAEVAAGRRSSYSAEKRYVRRDGEVRWVNVTVTMAKDRSFGVGMIEDITDRRGLEEERQRLLARTVEVAEAERSSLAADLHDGPIQHLTAVTLTLDLLANKLARGDVDGATELAQWLRESIAGEMSSLRRLMTELRPALLDERGLEATLLDCAAAVLDGEPVAFTLEYGLNGHRLAPELEAVIYRVVREALTNVRKHAHARTARVSLMVDDGRVDLVVEDDGGGFFPGGTNGDHVGVLTMRERVESVGGSWTLRAAPGEGTQIRAELPRKLRALERVTL